MTDLLRTLAELVSNRDFDEALDLCRSAIAQGLDDAFWSTQLAYVCFLNEHNITTYYSSPQMFQEVCHKYPRNIDACFWYGYALLIVSEQTLYGLEQLRRVIRLTPDHVYANIAIAGSTSSLSEKEARLEHALSIQPDNYRVMEDLSTVLAKTGGIDRAIGLLERISATPPFIETEYGIMNDYVNGPLTLARLKDAVRERARQKIAALRGQANGVG